MRFLADESCDFAVVRALRAAGHDVQAVAEAARGAKDSQVIQLASRDRRVLLTEDKDFGWLVYAAGQGSLGIILVRFPGNARRAMAAAVLEAIERAGQGIVGTFTVVEPGRIRHNRIPPKESD
jgi:predicted nuclease of predicted toxin-antitoxin system